jgi:hypothetical protein
LNLLLNQTRIASEALRPKIRKLPLGKLVTHLRIFIPPTAEVIGAILRRVRSRIRSITAVRTDIRVIPKHIELDTIP